MGGSTVVDKHMSHRFMRRQRGGFAWLMLAVMAACSARTEALPQQSVCEADCVAIGQWQFNLGVGLGVRLNPLVAGDDTPLLVLPEVSYYGRRFFLRNLDMGFTLVETARHQLNLLATPSYDQMYFNRWDPLNLTFAGGASTVSSHASAAPPANQYTDINVSGAPLSAAAPSDGGGGSSAPDPLDSEAAPPKDYDAIRFSGSVSSDALIEINGEIIRSSTSISGAEGNTIDIRFAEGQVQIGGLTASDQFNLRSTGEIELRGVSGDSLQSGMSISGRNSIRIDTSEAGFFILADTPPAAGETPPDKSAAVKEAVPYDGVKKRRLSGLAGIEYSYSAEWVSLHFQALQDFTNVHRGHEYRVAMVLPWTLASQKLALTVGANHKSQQVLNYYYGIDASEAHNANWQYAVPSAGTEVLVRADWQKPISDKWTLRAKLQYLGLPGEIANSPLVAKDYVFSAFVGGVYHF